MAYRRHIEDDDDHQFSVVPSPLFWFGLQPGEFVWPIATVRSMPVRTIFDGLRSHDLHPLGKSFARPHDHDAWR
jgi:hypothetical protein